MKVEEFLAEPITHIQYQALMLDIAEIRQSHERLLQWIIAMNAGMSTMAKQELDRLNGRTQKRGSDLTPELSANGEHSP